MRKNSGTGYKSANDCIGRTKLIQRLAYTAPFSAAGQQRGTAETESEQFTTEMIVGADGAEKFLGYGALDVFCYQTRDRCRGVSSFSEGRLAKISPEMNDSSSLSDHFFFTESKNRLQKKVRSF